MYELLVPGLQSVDVCCFFRTYALKRGMVGASGTASTGGTEDSMLLPLWGQICCKLEVEPECATEARITGFVNVHVSNRSV